MGFLVLRTEDVDLVVDGADTPDDDPLVLISFCRRCGQRLHQRALEANDLALKTSHQLAQEDAEKAVAHRAACPQRGHAIIGR